MKSEQPFLLKTTYMFVALLTRPLSLLKKHYAKKVTLRSPHFFIYRL